MAPSEGGGPPAGTPIGGSCAELLVVPTTAHATANRKVPARARIRFSFVEGILGTETRFVENAARRALSVS